jgi:hypothetical protein
MLLLDFLGFSGTLTSGLFPLDRTISFKTVKVKDGCAKALLGLPAFL